jgi:hypothetical protein
MRTQSLLSFLFESPLKFWKQKQANLSQEQLTKAKGYFEALTGQLEAYISGVDLTTLSFKTVELLYLSILEAKNFEIKAKKGGNWLAKQIVNNPSLKIENVEEASKKVEKAFKNVKEDYIPVLVSYNENLKKPEIKDINLDNVSDIQQLNSILNSLGSEICITATEAELGKVTEKDGWEVFLPHTTEASIVLGKRYCGKRDNTWCTTRDDAQNLFLNYAIINKVALFYVIKKGQCADRGNPEYKMSVGFVNGEPKFNMGSGNITVDADNENLTFERFQQVLGEELADEFLEEMKQRMGVLGNEPPALKEIEMLVATPEKFKQKFEGYKDNENGDAARKQFADFALESNKTSPEVINYLATVKYNDVREYIVNHPNTPAEALKILAGDEEKYIRGYVARNPNTPEETFKILATDKDHYVRQSVAKNPNTPTEALKILAGDEEKYIRGYVAENPNTPEETFKILATDKDHYVRQSVAKNPKTPEETLIQLARDKAGNVRYPIAINPNTPAEAFKILAGDENPDVRGYIARNPKTPEETLIQLTGDDNDIVRQYVAKNPNTPAEALKILSKDEDFYVRQSVAKNPKTPEETLIQLTGDDNDIVRTLVARNPNTPAEAFKILANDPNNYIKTLAIQNAQKRNLPLQESKYNSQKNKSKLSLKEIIFGNKI